jgi:hypothetical protein
VALERTEVSEEFSVSFIRVTIIGELGAILIVIKFRVIQNFNIKRIPNI